MPEEQERKFRKREPAKYVFVKDLSRELNRVALVGTIVSRNQEILSFVLDDGTGSVNVIINNAEQFNKLKDGQVVRVFGRIWGEGDDIELQGDLVQDFSKLDLNLFRKVLQTTEP